jgi:hypothetical protein
MGRDIPDSEGSCGSSRLGQQRNESSSCTAPTTQIAASQPSVSKAAAAAAARAAAAAARVASLRKQPQHSRQRGGPRPHRAVELHPAGSAGRAVSVLPASLVSRGRRRRRRKETKTRRRRQASRHAWASRGGWRGASLALRLGGSKGGTVGHARGAGPLVVVRPRAHGMVPVVDASFESTGTVEVVRTGHGLVDVGKKGALARRFVPHRTIVENVGTVVKPKFVRVVTPHWVKKALVCTSKYRVLYK